MTRRVLTFKREDKIIELLNRVPRTIIFKHIVSCFSIRYIVLPTTVIEKTNNKTKFIIVTFLL